MTSERKFIAENTRRILLKEYLMKMTERAGFGGLTIQRTPMGTRVALVAERPGMVIGRKGATIKEITEVVANKFKFDNPQIEVLESENPNLNAQIMAHKLASALERGWHFRRAGHSSVRRIMDSGAKGCQIVISGKLTGQRHRTERFKEGQIKYCGETKLLWMDMGFAVAKKKLGVIGVKVQIMRRDAKLPDEINIVESPPADLPLPEQPVLAPAMAVETAPAEPAVVEAAPEAPAAEPVAEPAPAEPAAEAAPAEPAPKRKRAKKEAPAAADAAPAEPPKE